jgi:hypothetical protein
VTAQSRCSVLAFVLLAACGETHDDGLSTAIKEQVDVIVATDLDIQREEFVASLIRMLSEKDLTTADDASIDQVARLLADDNDPIRGEAAMALGLFGPRAQRTVPELKRAMERYERELADEQALLLQLGESPDNPGWLVTADTRSPDEICRALVLIGDNAPPEHCAGDRYAGP